MKLVVEGSLKRNFLSNEPLVSAPQDSEISDVGLGIMTLKSPQSIPALKGCLEILDMSKAFLGKPQLKFM